MNQSLLDIIKESIQIELNLAELYDLCARIFSDHFEFWNQLAIEENGHASILEGGEEYFNEGESFPKEILYTDSLQTLKDINFDVMKLIEKFKKSEPSLSHALNMAYQFEISYGERFFESAMNKKFPGRVLKIFQQLNGDNKNHAQRIQAKKKEITL